MRAAVGVRVLFWMALAIVAVTSPSAAPLSAGGNHSLAVGPGGTALAWGGDDWGQLGSGRTLAFATPLPIPALNGAQAISGGLIHVVALMPGGTVVAAGDNLAGQLGDGSRSARSTPAPVTGLAGVVAIEAGAYFNLAVLGDGTLRAWGDNSNGQLGDGTTANRSLPVTVAGLAGVAGVSAGYDHSLAVRTDGTVWAWGANATGQLGDGTNTDRSRPVAIPGLADIVAVAAGEGFSLALARDGTVWSWGKNGQGQLGNGAEGNRNAPVRVANLGGVAAISAGGDFAMALRSDGTVWTWGYNLFDQLGDAGATFLLSRVPVQAAGLGGVTSIVAGYAHAFARRSDGSLWSWGYNSDGQLGDGTTANRSVPARVASLAGIAGMAAGRYFSHAVAADGRAFGWGSNSDGQLGSGIAVYRTVPGATAGLSNVVAVAAGYGFALALRGDGTVWTWGSNVLGTLGTGSGPARSTPGQVAGLAGVTAIAAGFNLSVALRSDGTVWAWGSNLYGELGANAPSLWSETPVQIDGLTQVTAIATGFSHILALRSDGTVRAIGYNGDGQLGDGSSINRSRPVTVAGVGDAIAVGAGWSHSLAVRRDGTVVAWGNNLYGELGDGTTVSRTTPVAVTGLAAIASVAGGSGFSMAVGQDGRVFGWGSDVLLGGASALPVLLSRLPKAAAVAAGLFHNLVEAVDGSVWAWGLNESAQLGDGTVVDRSLPVVALREGGAGSIAGNDWFLDLNPSVPSTIPADSVPVFLVVASPESVDVKAQVRFRPEDVGTTGSLFVFASAPADIVRPAANGSAFVLGKAAYRDGRKADAVACVLAQLNSAGQLQAVSASSLQAYVTGVLSGQGQAVTVINGANAVNIGGATFYVGYGSSAGAMLGNGLNRGVVSVPGAKECRPQPPQTGWWWNPAEAGRGFSIEANGRNLFYAAYLYDESGRSKWHVAAGPTSLDGSLFTGSLLELSGGQTLAGAYRPPSPARSVGAITLAFANASAGTMVWPGGSVPIERFDIVANGLASPPRPNVPESGWWWNPAESGRGFFIEWQNGTADIAGYMYDDAGNPVWYLSVIATPEPRAMSGNWWSFGNGQTLTGAWRPASRTSDNAGPLSIQFDSSTTATLTLPGGRTTRLQRFRF